MRKRSYAVAFTGPSNSGKTTLIAKIVRYLQGKKRVAVIKHDPGDKARFDTPGKDSHIFFEAGADVAVMSPTRTSYFSHRSHDIETIAAKLHPFDLLLVEGLKHLPLPRIAIFRNAIDESYLPYVDAIAIDDSVPESDLKKIGDLRVLDLNDTAMIVAWIENNAKELG